MSHFASKKEERGRGGQLAGQAKGRCRMAWLLREVTGCQCVGAGNELRDHLVCSAHFTEVHPKEVTELGTGDMVWWLSWSF